MNVKKLVFVGDSFCGKTCIIRRLSKSKFRKDLELTDFPGIFEVQVVNKNRCVTLIMYDTPGNEDLPYLRQLAYPTNTVLLVFDVSQRSSFENIFSLWCDEIKEFCPGASIILVGNKTDLRTSAHSSVSTLEGQNACKTIGAVAYIECSALTGEGIHDLLMTCSEGLLTKSNCSIL